MRFHKNISSKYDKLMQAFDIYLSAAGLSSTENERKIFTCVKLAGEETSVVFKKEEENFNFCINYLQLLVKQYNLEDQNKSLISHRLILVINGNMARIKTLPIFRVFGTKLGFKIKNRPIYVHLYVIVYKFFSFSVLSECVQCLCLTYGKQDSQVTKKEASRKVVDHTQTFYCTPVSCKIFNSHLSVECLLLIST